MSHRKSQLQLDTQGIAVDADIRTAKLDPESVGTQPDIVRRDEKTGKLIHREVYDKATGEPLESGYGYRYVTEDGDPVPNDRIDYYRITAHGEAEFSRFEPTLGAGRVLSPVTWIPIHTIDQYLIE